MSRDRGWLLQNQASPGDLPGLLQDAFGSLRRSQAKPPHSPCFGAVCDLRPDRPWEFRTRVWALLHGAWRHCNKKEPLRVSGQPALRVMAAARLVLGVLRYSSRARKMMTAFR